ncbi:single strand DNA binding protein [Bacillus phage DLc1]|uniref:Single-stranded DNA-binding protein n=1 Tax=Bacillus phage DLc1 TaxID=2777318 RepID=A0A7M1RQ72_9CAUD|nr:single strand DNA binding protein [Bacillus phage DLc1]QOR56274.1 hypothetical protein [Bacillus phage DLc1]
MMNRTVLVGRLTKDADLRYTPNGKAVATVTLAVQRNFKNQAGEYEADFPQVVIWGKQAETVANFVKKGHMVGFEGQLRTRSYGEGDAKRYVTEVLADNFTFLEKKQG